MNRLITLAMALFWLAPQSSTGSRVAAVIRDAFVYRNLGPFRAGGWVSDIAVPETPSRSHLYTFYVAARHGGVWKTANNGTTFEPIFDSQNTFSIGALAVAPSNEDIVWVGTGEASNARSSYSGNGIYKSLDGGKTWQQMGLGDSQHISRILVHPSNPDVVYVAAMGHLFSTNEERGVFKTTDGGKTWKKILYIDNKTGAIDLVMKRSDPNTLYAAMYECQRFPWRLGDGGPGSGIHKTTDGGATWTKLGGGFPSGTIGRIGIDVYQKDPRILYAVVDNRNTQSPIGQIYKSEDEGLTWKKMSADNEDVSRKSGYAFNQLRIDTSHPDRIFITGSSLASSEDGGKTWAGLQGGPQQTRPFRRAFGDFRTLWVDPFDSDRMIAGSDGGVFVSYDGGRTNDHLLSLPLGEVYALTVDMENPYNIYAGLQDHESWKGPSNGWSGSIGIEDWVTVGIGDGMYNQVDPTDSRWVYNTQEFGHHARLDQVTRVRTNIAPSRSSGPPLRFNWVAPIRISPHDPKVLYAGAEVLFRSADRGDHWTEISPDLTTNDAAKISPPGGSIQFCTITTIAESPVTAGVVWVGTDDGKVQVTRNTGASWTDATPAIAAAGGPQDAWVTRVFPSHASAGTAYIAKSRHRQDDFRALLYKTTDFGATWTSVSGNLPARTINVVFEDQKNPNLLFVGNDAGVYISVDAGKQWSPLKGNMPTVPVHDIVVHARENDLVVGTYGRGIWVTDITPLREITEQVLAEDAHFFKVEAKSPRRDGALGNYRLYGDRIVTTPNEANGLVFNYYLKDEPNGKATIIISDSAGKSLRTPDAPSKAGINRMVGDMNHANPRPLPAGEYNVTLQVAHRKYVPSASILPSTTERR